MRKTLAYLVALVLVAGAVAAVALAINSRGSSDKKSTTSTVGNPDQGTRLTSKQACSIFTLADAKQLLGDTAKGGENPISNSSGDLVVTTCTYTQDEGNNAPVSSRKSATLLVRAPKTSAGAASNQRQFGPLRPDTAQDVVGYGDSAYWDADHGQLNILKHDSWYILSYGPVTPTDRTLDETKNLADTLINKM